MVVRSCEGIRECYGMRRIAYLDGAVPLLLQTLQLPPKFLVLARFFRQCGFLRRVVSGV